MGSSKQVADRVNLPVELSAISRTLPDEPDKPIQHDGLPQFLEQTAMPELGI